MRLRMTAAIALLIAAVALGIGLAPVAAQDGGDLDCGDPGTSPNMPVDPNNDPHGLDDDDDGVGCEDPNAFGGGTAPAPAGESEPATPVEAEPTFTG
jgi:hypothetical protein